MAYIGKSLSTGAGGYIGTGLDRAIRTRPNFVINGSCQINQRGNSTGVTNAGSGYHGPDRYKFNEDGTMTAIVSIERETLTSGNAYNDGHLYAYKLSVTTADTAVAADIYTRITHRFEKDNLATLSKGSSSAKAVTLSFWVKATVTGTNVVEFFDQVNSRQVGATYAISSSNTWEYKKVTFPADTSGALGSGNGLAAEINFVLQAGSDYTSGTLDTSWASETAANRAAGHNSNHFSSTSNTFHFTGVQLEIGDLATAFEHEDIGTTLRKCQRYFTKSWSQGSAVTTNAGVIGAACVGNANRAFGNVFWPVTMRSAPTVTWYSGSTGTANKWRNASQGTDITAASPIAAIGQSGYGFVLSSGIVGITDTLQGHYQAEAEL